MTNFTKEENLNKLKLKACEYMESLSEIRGSDFNAGQALGIKLMFQWLKDLESQCPEQKEIE